MANEILQTKIVKNEAGQDCIIALVHSTWSTTYGVTQINLFPHEQHEAKETMLFHCLKKTTALNFYREIEPAMLDE